MIVNTRQSTGRYYQLEGHPSFCFQSLLQAHDVVAQEVYGDAVVRTTPAYAGPNSLAADANYDQEYGGHNNGGITENRPGGDDGMSDTTCDVTRIRLVQFQRNTDEPLVRRSNEIAHGENVDCHLGHHASHDR